MVKVNRKVKDRLFRLLFQDKKDLLDLYNAVADKSYTDPDALTVNTLEDAVYIGMKNDLSFLISDTLNLYEHQSTVNKNMPLRGLFYLTELYRGYLEQHGLKVHRSARINLPFPQYLVFYNGKQMMPERSEMRLSESFHPVDTGEEPSLECRAVVLNINLGKNAALMEKCLRLKEYAIFIDCIRKRQVNGRLTKEAVMEAMDECIKNGVLAEFLRKHRGEVLEVTWYEYNEEEYIKDEKEISREEGRKEGVALINQLNGLLIEAKRYDDLERATNDLLYQKQLLEEFGL